MIGFLDSQRPQSIQEVISPQTSQSTRILIGGAGAPNYGDELIIRAWIERFSPPIHAAEPLVFFENSAESCHKFHHSDKPSLATRVSFRDDLTDIADSEKSLAFWNHVERGFTFMRDFGFAGIGYQGNHKLFNALSFHLHGGGYFYQPRADKGFFLGLAASFAKIYGIPAFATGIGFGPFDDACPNPERFEEILSYFQLFETRDAASHLHLSRLAPSANLISGVDDSFFLPDDKIFRRDSSVRRLHLSLITHHLKDLPEGFWPWLVAQSAHFDEIKFWVSFPWEDQEAIDRAQAELPRCSIITARECVFYRPPIGESDVFIVQRFHVHLAAARAGARGFYLAHDDYYRQKHESLVALGSGLLPLNGADLPNLGSLPQVQPLDESGLHERKLRVYAACQTGKPS